ncbi:YitT family protein [Atopobacter sp. AH10]|uniref:YitT family protein n=1 Tax=Atopobacter sp. AH10 TaxID=2315861 RepID=UPI000EF1E515|nr:YitT family protein [Atopobacter sp. AH10]RLK63731.1 YitT family protein [Atopobacter sp. AH10]
MENDNLLDGRKNKKYRQLILSLLAVCLSAFLQTFCYQVFLKPSHMLASGFLGTSMLINIFADNYLHLDIPVPFLLVALNLPVALMCMRGISLRFTALSLLQIAISSTFMRLCHFQPIFDDLSLNIIFGGALNGFYISLALLGRASTGGMDFIALYVSNKKGKTIWEYVLLINTIMLLTYGYITNWRYAGYSIILQFISTRVVSTFHKRYKLYTLNITTTRGEAIRDAFVNHIRHGITCIPVKGGYTQQDRTMLITVVSSYEVNDVIDLLQQIDPYVIISINQTERFIGRFHREPE